MSLQELSPEEISAKIADATEVVKYLSANIKVLPNHVCTFHQFSIHQSTQVFEGSECRSFRRGIQPLVEHQRKKMFGGVSLQEHNSELQRKKRSESMRSIQKAEDKKLLESTMLRAERLKRLVKIEDQDGLEHNLVLDGCAEDGSAINSTVLLCDQNQTAGPSDTSSNSSSHNPGREGAVSNGTSASVPQLFVPEEHLNQFRSCYICKRRFSKLHHFYHSLCELCASHNWKKRMQTCNMTGRVCLVTGGRVKIGFQCCLKLLRCGATVICTSRFPVDAAKRFALQRDYIDWKDRLFTMGLDLRDLAYLEYFCQNLSKHFPQLDVIVNNACQTIRRPRGYYAHMMQDELRVSQLARGTDGCEDVQLTVGECDEAEETGGSERSSLKRLKKKPKCVLEGKDICSLLSLETSMRDGYNAEMKTVNTHQLADSSDPSQSLLSASAGVSPSADALPTSTLSSAELSQVALTGEDHEVEEGGHLLPANLRDVNNQQIDLRRKNSWLLRTDEVETPEVAEVFAINSISPFVLISKLKRMLRNGKKSFAEDIASDKSPSGREKRAKLQDGSRLKTLNEFILGVDGDEDAWTKSAANHRGTNLTAVGAQNCSFIVNVSSMEGKFYRPKTVFHSHTNMAKAALNMLTRTASMDYQSGNIYMSAVDTGWINDENPLEKASRIAQTSNFCTPLDEVDAAARILDPVFTPLSCAQEEGQGDLCSPPFGCFLKDYHISEW